MPMPETLFQPSYSSPRRWAPRRLLYLFQEKVMDIDVGVCETNAQPTTYLGSSSRCSKLNSVRLRGAGAGLLLPVIHFEPGRGGSETQDREHDWDQGLFTDTSTANPCGKIHTVKNPGSRTLRTSSIWGHPTLQVRNCLGQAPESESPHSCFLLRRLGVSLLSTGHVQLLHQHILPERAHQLRHLSQPD